MPREYLKSQAKEKLTQQEEHFIEIQNHCALCGTELIIKIESYLENYYLREEANCPQCEIKTREKDHRMH